MYSPLFAALYQGSMSGKADLLLVWPCMLAHADPKGNVDLHPRVIAALVGISQDRVEAAIMELEADDPESRTQDPVYQGRRIVPIDEGRRWGWFVVNHKIYRQMASLGAIRAQAAERQARKRQRDSERRHDPSRTSHASVTEPSRTHHATVTQGGGGGRGKKNLELVDVTARHAPSRSDDPTPPAEPPETTPRPLAGCLAAYAVAWKARYGTDPRPSAKDCIAANAALKVYPTEERALILEAFVADDDPWLVERAHRLGLLPGQLDRIRAKLSKKPAAAPTTHREKINGVWVEVPLDPEVVR